jgi:preprotein translocase subunit YajC
MEIISLLPFFIFLLFVFLTIYRTKQRLKNLAKSSSNISKSKKIRLKSGKNDEEKKTGWKNILIEAYEQIQREIKAAQEKKQPKYHKSEKAPETSKPTTILWEKETLIPSPPPIPSKEIKKKKTAPAPRKPESVKVQESKDVKPHLPLIQKPTVQDLRKAIVWSEILAPPVALRENQDIF